MCIGRERKGGGGGRKTEKAEAIRGSFHAIAEN